MVVVWRNVIMISYLNKVKNALPGIKIIDYFMYLGGGYIKPDLTSMDVEYEFDGKVGKVNITKKEFKDLNIVAGKLYRNLKPKHQPVVQVVEDSPKEDSIIVDILKKLMDGGEKIYFRSTPAKIIIVSENLDDANNLIEEIANTMLGSSTLKMYCANDTESFFKLNDMLGLSIQVTTRKPQSITMSDLNMYDFLICVDNIPDHLKTTTNSESVSIMSGRINKPVIIRNIAI